MKPALNIVLFLLVSTLSFADVIPEKYAGVWELSAYMQDGKAKSPSSIHYLIITTSGEMTRVKDFQNPARNDASRHKFLIDKRNVMSTIAPDGSRVVLGTATISEKKLHLEATGGGHHLVYSPARIQILK